MPYVEVDNVDATADKAKSLGATVIVGPDDIPGTGRFAVIQDPQGATFGIYKSSRQSIAWDGTPILHRFSWHELMTTDHNAAAKFYTSLFGWEKISEMDMGDGLMYYIFGKNGKMFGGLFTTPKEMAGMHPFWLVYINVKDVGKSVEVATKAGATVHRPQMDIPGGSIAILGDPQGAGFALHHVTVPVAAPTPAAKKAAPAKKAAAKKAAPKKKAPSKTVAAKKAAPKKKAAVKKAAPKKKAKAKAKAPARKAKAKKAKARPKAKAPARRKAKAPKRKAKAKK